jgi:AcrR family transcriptional regulator
MPEDGLERRLIAAGVALLAEGGTDAISLREIARRAGVSHGAPRRYFPTHQALLGAIAREGYRKLGGLIDPPQSLIDPPPTERAGAGATNAVLTLGRRYLDFAREEPAMYALMFRHDLLRGNEIGLREASTPLFGVLVDLLDRAGVPEPRTRAAALWANLHGIAQLWQWGSLQVVTGAEDPDGLLTAAVEAHLRKEAVEAHLRKEEA